MRTAVVTLVLLVTASLSGCAATSPRGGGASAAAGFTVSVPGAAVSLRPGQSRDVRIAVNRGHRFEQAVAVGIRASDGVAVDPNNLLFRHGSRSRAAVRVTADPRANAGDYRVYVRGTPEAGAATAVEFLVRVTAP